MQKQIIVKSTGEDDKQRIYKIQLTNRNITNITSLRQYPVLRCLILSYNLIERIQNLQILNDLRELHLQNNGIKKIEGLENNKNLTVINLAYNKIEKIENMGQLMKLKTLNLDYNCISKLTGLQYLNQLRTLSVCHNNLESIDNLPTCSKIENLLLNHNKIKSVNGNIFSNSKELKVLDLSYNKIEPTNFMQYFSNLEILNLSHNSIKFLEATVVPNLQSLILAFNEIDALPSLSVCFPQLISLDISHNFLASEFELLSAISEANYLTELNFLENPMYSQSFESAIQKVHKFDFLNNKIMSKAGAKYYDQVAEIRAELEKNRQIYQNSEYDDKEFKTDFFDEDLDFQMNGVRSIRPVQIQKKRNLQKPTFYDDIDRNYHEIMANHMKIKVIRQHYLKIYNQYDSASQHILTQLPPQTQILQYTNSEQLCGEQKKKDDKNQSISQQLYEKGSEMKRQQQKNLNLWKQLKNKQKKFNIRDVIKSRGRQGSMNKGRGSSTNTNWTNNAHQSNLGPAAKSEKQKIQLFKTQTLPRKRGQQMLRTITRPVSTRKK